eukprot:TRINITY_DN7174_c0_g1_i1.p4 TRINITY_DN7174_c0_g1~~TRINITY_DN7174_c0_g1_i1.p4  ORF type:complete len:293 (-),score=-21.99 TRINITY_DN7174_c0_g1_i1:561-1439(-)
MQNSTSNHQRKNNNNSKCDRQMWLIKKHNKTHTKKTTKQMNKQLKMYPEIFVVISYYMRLLKLIMIIRVVRILSNIFLFFNITIIQNVQLQEMQRDNLRTMQIILTKNNFYNFQSTRMHKYDILYATQQQYIISILDNKPMVVLQIIHQYNIQFVQQQTETTLQKIYAQTDQIRFKLMTLATQESIFSLYTQTKYTNSFPYKYPQPLKWCSLTQVCTHNIVSAVHMGIVNYQYCVVILQVDNKYMITPPNIGTPLISATKMRHLSVNKMWRQHTYLGICNTGGYSQGEVTCS